MLGEMKDRWNSTKKTTNMYHKDRKKLKKKKETFTNNIVFGFRQYYMRGIEPEHSVLET